MTEREAIAEAKRQLSQADYHSEISSNRGIAAMYGKKADWLRPVIRMAEAALSEGGTEDG